MHDKTFEIDFSDRFPELMAQHDNPLREHLDDACNLAVMDDKTKKITELLGTEAKQTPPNWNWTTDKSYGHIVCFDYALGLCDSPDYLNSLQHNEYFRVNSSFIRYLIENQFIKKLSTPSENCMVLYFKRSCGLIFASELIEPSDWSLPDYPSNLVVLIKKQNISFSNDFKAFTKNGQWVKDEKGNPIEKLIQSNIESKSPMPPHFEHYIADENHKEVTRVIRETVSMIDWSLDCQPTHAGLIINGDKVLVESKFGSIPALFLHDLWKVPKSYGSEKPHYYTRPSCKEIYEILIDYRHKKREENSNIFKEILKKPAGV